MWLFSRRSDAQRTIFDRKDQRNSTFVIVEIKNEWGSLLERASLRDLSANGALIRTATRQELPGPITLYFPADHMLKSAKVRWQEGNSAGVEFDEPVVLPERLRNRKDRIDVVASHFRQAGI